MTTDADVVVVGAGPIGLAAGIEARLAGLGVVVIEPRDGPIDKACGEGLMPGALPLLDRLGVHPEGVPLRGVSYRNGTDAADHLFAASPGLGVRRTTLHAALSTRADELGVERVTGRVDSVEQDAGSVRATMAGPGAVSGRWLLGCDGLHSTVRRSVGLEGRAPARNRRFGLRQHFAVEPWNDLIEVHWSARAEAYVTPVSATTVGVAILGPRGTGFADALAAVPELAGRLAGAPPVSSLLGAGPFRQRALSPAAGRVLLVGDASGYVDAITGEGLRLGLDQVRAAVACIVSGSSRHYPERWRTVTRDFRVLTNGLVWLASTPLRAAIVPAARSMPWLYGGIVERLAR